MSPALVVPVVLGTVVVLQATLNRAIAARWTLSGAAVLNTLIAVLLATGYFAWVLSRGEGVSLRDGLTQLRWWWLLPGCFGFALVVGLPWTLQRVGALTTFVALVGAQMLVGVLWDGYMEGTPLTGTRVAGALLAIASVALVHWK